MECVGNRIISSFPQPADISQSAIIDEIMYNRQLLERLKAAIDNLEAKTLSEPAKPESRQFPVIRFAQMADNSSPLGFRMASLSDISHGACYQIVIDSETKACYRLITDLSVQREIIAMFNPIITSGCEYEELPAAINGFVNVEDGQLELHSGIWQIVKKAKIRFI